MTAEEKKEIKLAVLDEIKTESNDITEIETVSTLDGLTGLPAMQGKKLVTAPLSLLSKPATDAAVTANSAADTANKAAQTATNAAATANKAADTIKPWLRGTLGSFDSSEAFNNYLDGLTYNSLKSGRYVAYLGGVPFFVTFTLLYAKEQISAVWVEGSLMVSGNAINSNTGKGVTIAYRYHKNGAWEAWKTIYDDVRTDIPTAQTSVNGTNKNYIYSTNDRESTYTVLSGKIWMYTHTDRNLFLRFKNWGAENDTNATNYNQVLLCYLVNKNQDGLMDKYVFARILNHNLAEGQSTTDKVIVNYTNFAESGNKQLELTKATTAKAGVMTVAQVNALNKASEDVKALNDSLQGFQEDLTEFKNTKGHSNGLAPLDERGKVASKYLPEYVDDVLEFGGIVSGITPQIVSLDKYSFDANCSVVYSKDSEVFMLKYEQPSTSPFLPATITYYNNWIDGDLFGEPSANGRVPHSGKIYIDVTANKTYNWRDGTLKTIGGATAQDGAHGTSENYIYSASGDEMHTALSSKIWIYQHGDYNQFLRIKHWGANNDTSESNYSQVQLPNAWTGGTGLLKWDVYRRLDEFKLREENSTVDAVNIVTPIFTTGGTRSFPISKATTAKAGVMTAADKMKLDGLSDISAEGARAAKALYAAAGGTKLFGPNNIFDTNNGTLGGAVNKALYDSSTPTEYTKGSPFEVFCTQGIKSGAYSKKYMIWFGLRKSMSNIERYSCQQVIGQTEEEFYAYRTPVAFRLNDGEVYTPFKGTDGLSIDTSTLYIVSRECVIPSYSDLHDAATSEKDGLMSASDKAQLDVIAASIDSFGNSITEQAKRIYDLEQCKPLATKSRNGFMSSEDKTQLQGAFADFNARRQAHGVEGYIGKSNVISVPGTVGNAQIAAEFYRNAEERDYTPGASFDVYISAGYDENHPNKQCVWFGLHIGPTLYVRYRLDYWLHGTADTLVGKYLCDTSDKYYEVREGAVGEYISEALDDTPCIMTIADKRLLNQIKQKLGL